MVTKRKKSGRVIGYETELKAKERLEKLGYLAIRSAGSHGAADVTGIRGSPRYEAIGVQCKHHDDYKLPNVQKNYAVDIARLRSLIPYGIQPMLWVRLKGGKWVDFVVTAEDIYTITWTDNVWEVGEQLN